MATDLTFEKVSIIISLINFMYNRSSLIHDI
jgi:hypothetical protein